MKTRRSAWNERLLDGAIEGDLVLMQEALQHGADVNTTRKTYRDDCPPFVLACFFGQLEAVRFLSTVPGIDLNIVDNNGYSAFHYACLHGNLEVMRFLATLPGFTLLLSADNNGFTGLHLAAFLDHLAVLRYLLSSNLGFDVEARVENYGWSALHVACCKGHLDVLECLLTEYKADLQAVDMAGMSCIHIAVKKARVNIVRYLLANCPEFATKTCNEGSTPLHDVAFAGSGELEISRVLLEHGAKVNARDNRGKTPLHEIAGHSRSVELVQELIFHGADLLATDNDGNTPFDDAIRNRDNEVADYILTIAYRDLLVGRDGNRAVHGIFEAARYQYVVLQQRRRRRQQQQQQQQQTLQIQLPVGRLTRFHFRTLLRSFDRVLMRQQDKTGAVPFHIACRTGAPAEILKPLLKKFPGALHIAVDNSDSLPGSLPLHCACQAQSPSLEVLQFLVNQDPAAVRALDNAGALPLHLLCGCHPPDNSVDFLLAEYEGSISVKADNGYLPLMVSCKNGASHSVVGTVMRTYPDALKYIVQEFDSNPPRNCKRKSM